MLLWHPLHKVQATLETVSKVKSSGQEVVEFIFKSPGFKRISIIRNPQCPPKTHTHRLADRDKDRETQRDRKRDLVIDRDRVRISWGRSTLKPKGEVSETQDQVEKLLVYVALPSRHRLSLPPNKFLRLWNSLFISVSISALSCLLYSSMSIELRNFFMQYFPNFISS